MAKLTEDRWLTVRARPAWLARVPVALSRIFFGAVRFSIGCLIVGAFQSSWLISDEIIIDGRLGEPVELGGISWSPKYGFSGSLLELQASNPGIVTSQSCELTAGELYSFFKRQGIQSVDQLVVVLSVPNSTAGDLVVVEGLQVRVDGSTLLEDNSTLLANTSSDDRIVIPGGQSISGRAEAKLMIPLGFDFMERYSENSTERLVLQYKIDGASISDAPVFAVEGQSSWSRGPTYAWVGLFIGFWLVLFWVLRVVTLVRPQTQKPADGASVHVDRVEKQAVRPFKSVSPTYDDPASFPLAVSSTIPVDAHARESKPSKSSQPLINSLH